jgi:scyllo-inositol 2-dehydrogenase (NADP+)
MIKVVFVGCGNITNLRHIPAIKSLKRDLIEVLGVIGINQENVLKSAKLSKSLNHFIGNISELEFPVWISEADLIIVGTPPQTHLEILQNLLKLNSKANIIVEKPFSLGSQDAQVDPSVLANSGRVFVMHNFQFADGFSRVLHWLNSGKIGEVISVTGFQSSTKDRRLPSWHEELPSGLFWDEAVHFFYLLKSFVGDLKVVDGSAIYKNGLETPATLTISLIGSQQIPIQINMNFNAALSEWGLVISGSNGTILYDLFRDIPIFLPHDGQHLPLNILRTSATLIIGHLRGFVINGIKYIFGNLHYGINEVIKRVISLNPDSASIAPINLAAGIQMVELMDDSVKFFKINSTII